MVVLPLPLLLLSPALLKPTPLIISSLIIAEGSLGLWAAVGWHLLTRQHIPLAASHVLSWAKAIPIGLALGLIANGLLMATSVLIQTLSPALSHTLFAGNTAPFTAVFHHMTSILFILFAFQSIVISPLVEEWFFRGFLWTALKGYGSSAFATLLSAAVFGLYHFEIHSLLPLFLMGCLLGLVRSRFGLRMSWAVHAGFNALSIGLLVVSLH